MTANVWCDRCNRQHVVRRPQAVRRGPQSAGWRDAIEALAGVLVLLLFGVAFFLWSSILVAVQP